MLTRIASCSRWKTWTREDAVLATAANAGMILTQKHEYQIRSSVLCTLLTWGRNVAHFKP